MDLYNDVNLILYNKNFERECIIDVFHSLIWTDRYQSPGDFELYISPYIEFFEKAQDGYYLYNANSEHMMIIESIKTQTDIDTGIMATVTGRSLESILERRIIWNSTWFAGSIEECIKLIIDTNIINPQKLVNGQWVPDENRKIPNFEYVGCLGTEYQINQIKKMGTDFQSKGETVLQVIQNICKEFNIGFKVICDFKDGNKFKFYLYKGADRSIGNYENNILIEFSPQNDNLEESNYVEDSKKYKNVILVAGAGDVDKKKYAYLNNEKFTGLDRREVYTDASGVSEEVDGHRLSTAEYDRQLREKGKETLKKNEMQKAFEGKVISGEGTMYEFRRDFNVGDIVNLKNEVDKTGLSIISEAVESYNNNGYQFTPTFTKIEVEKLKITGTVDVADNGEFTIKGLDNKKLDIVWGDGNTEVIEAEEVTHTYQNGGNYEFSIAYHVNLDVDFCPIFTGSTCLDSIEIPNGVKTIPALAFNSCSKLSEIVLPSSVEHLEGDNAFAGCVDLYSIVLPNSIKDIGTGCFSGCSNLTSVNFPYSTEVVPSYFLSGCNVKSIDFPGNSLAGKGVKTVSSRATYGCTRLANLSFGSTVTSIDGSCTEGSHKDISITCNSYTPPSLSAGGFWVFDTNHGATDDNKKDISGITVPTSPNHDESVLNAYKNATGWSNYRGSSDPDSNSCKIKEKDDSKED